MRVPTVLAVGDDEDVLGGPFYVMDEVHGDVLASSIPDSLDTPVERARISEELVDALVEVHAVDWRACGSRATGSRPAIWSVRCAASAACGSTTRPASWRWWRSWASGSRDNMPDSQEATIVHGDYRLGNVMMRDSAPAELVAIFDWELSTIGDPLADLGYITVTWVESDDPQDTMFANLSAVTRREGFLTREGLIARYEERSGRSMSALTGTRRSRCGRRPCSWRATTSASRPATRTTSTSPVRPGRADARREGPRDRPLVKGLLVDFGGRPHHQRVRLLPRLLRGRGARPGGDQAPASARTRARSRACAGSSAASWRGGLRESASASCSS